MSNFLQPVIMSPRQIDVIKVANTPQTKKLVESAKIALHNPAQLEMFAGRGDFNAYKDIAVNFLEEIKGRILVTNQAAIKGFERAIKLINSNC